MKRFSEIMGKIRLMAVVAVSLGITAAGALGPESVRAGAPDLRPPDASTVARARASFLKHMSTRRTNVPSRMGPQGRSAGVTSFPSINWSGFADLETGTQTVSAVSGEWVIPYVECPPFPYQYQDTFIAQWVGIDGFDNGTVEQLGSATECFEGVPYYYVWVEMFPAGTIEEGTVACINNNVDCPQPGDRIAASVTVAPGGTYTLTLTDFTRPQESFSVTASCAPTTCVDSSAEWIVERPAFDLPFGFQILPLVNFFQTGFSGGTVTSGGNTTDIGGFQGGTVYNLPMADDTESYYLDCVGQRGPGPQLLQTTDASACPTVAPQHGRFGVTWDASF